MESIIDNLAHFFLKFGHITIILPVVVVCLVLPHRNLYAKAACCLFWVMIFNTLLKHIFKVPLFPHLGTGYAFPSGHMHASAAFYGYILCVVENKYIKIALGLLLACIGFSLIHCGFHDLLAVVGALGFAAVELALYFQATKRWNEKTIAIGSIISAIAIMIVLSIIHKIEPHVWIAFYGLVGMELVISIWKIQLKNTLQRCLALGISAAIIYGGYFLFKTLIR